MDYQTPGVYLEEVPSGARPIEAVGTRTAGFIGVAPNPTTDNTSMAIAVNNWAEFVRRFATDPNPDPKTGPKKFPSTNLSNAVYGFFLNGGNRCYVVNIGSSGTVQSGLDLLERIDEVAMVAAPGFTDNTTYTAIRDHCDKLRDRVGILDGPATLDDNAIQQLSGESATSTGTGAAASSAGATSSSKSKSTGSGTGSGTAASSNWTRPGASEYGQLTLYVPWIEISNPDYTPQSNSNTNPVPQSIMVPPSGHVAGIWARSDATRGVHKAPANEVVRGALDLAKQITNSEQGMLNQTGVNVIRFFPNEGFLVWGARTLTTDTSFLYLNVRRLFNMIEESIVQSTRWIVFEPNDRPLWKAIRRDVTSFLMGFWRDGALMGRTPEEAFYVKCDDETNPIESIREGKVIIEVGLAPVRPAEFVIFRISQYEAGSEVQVQS